METLESIIFEYSRRCFSIFKKKKKTPETEIFDFELQIFKIGLDVGNFSFSSVCNNDSLTFSFFFFYESPGVYEIRYTNRWIGKERKIEVRAGLIVDGKG